MIVNTRTGKKVKVPRLVQMHANEMKVFINFHVLFKNTNEMKAFVIFPVQSPVLCQINVSLPLKIFSIFK